jgi:hypothetical protein
MVAQLSSHICGLILPAFLLTKFSPSIKESLSVNSWQASNFLKYIFITKNINVMESSKI